MIRFISILVCFTLPWSAVWGQAKQVPTKKMTLYPASPPTPALKYYLLPQVHDMKPGNAAFHYQRAHSPEWYGPLLRSPDFDKVSDWVTMPLVKIPLDKARVFAQSRLLTELDLAARRESCDWEMTERLRQEGPSLLLPDLQSFRVMGLMLALRCRMQIMDGQFEQAARSLQTGLAFSRHVADAPILINGLVGLAMANFMANQMEEWIQQPKGPNLYWAVAELPRPFIDLRRAFQGERLLVDCLFPAFRPAMENPRHPPFTESQIQGFLTKFAELEETGSQDFLRKVGIVYPLASKFLAEHGWTEDQIKAMPKGQAVLMLAVFQWDQTFDEFSKWYGQPYWFAGPALATLEKKLQQSRKEAAHSDLLAGYLMPAVHRCLYQKTRLERRLALIQVLEALRLHAAQKDGALPTTLEDIKDVPIPLDPVTGKSFQYRVEGDKGYLVAPAPHGEVASEANEVRYEITLTRQK